MLQRLTITSLAILCSIMGAPNALASWQDDYASGQQALLYRDYAAAEQHLASALAQAEDFGSTDDRLARTLSELAHVYRMQRKDADAEPLLERAILLFDQATGPDNPNIAATLVAAAEVRANLHDARSAQPLAKRALIIRENQLGLSHPAVADTLDLLAMLQTRLRDTAAAEQLLRRALKIREESYGAHHRSVASSLDNLAELYITQRNLAEAEQLLARAMRIRRRTLGEGHPDNATSFDNLAQLHLARNEPVAARASLEQALDIRRTTLGQNHLLVAESLTNIADLSWSQGDYADAINQLATARGIRRSIMGAEHPQVIGDGKDLAELERLQRVASQSPATTPAPTLTDAPKADPVIMALAPGPIAPGGTAWPSPAPAPSPTQIAKHPSTEPPNGPALQLAAFKSAETAKAEWARIQGNFPQFLAGQELDLQRIDLGDRGIFYRVRTGPFASVSTAKAACTHMRDNKCIAPGSLDTSLSHAAGLSDIAVCHA